MQNGGHVRRGGASPIRRFYEWTTGGTTYRISDGKRFAIRDGEPGIWAVPGAGVSRALKAEGQPRTIDGIQFSRYVLKQEAWSDCLKAAEEIMQGKPGRLKDDEIYSGPRDSPSSRFGDGDDENVKIAQAVPAQFCDVDADPRVGEGFAIVATTGSGVTGYHAAAVVGADRNDRVTIEAWSNGTGGRGPGVAYMYTVGHPDLSFHGVWARHRVFKKRNPRTIVIKRFDGT